MKYLYHIIALYFLGSCGFQAWADMSLLKSSEWPFSAPTLFLKGGVNAVTAGDDLLFWAVGDTIEVVDKNSFSVVSKFRVSTSTAIQDILFDDTSERLYVAAGYDEKDQSGGLQIFDLSNIYYPSLSVIFDKTSDNPGFFRKSDNESIEVYDIDARGLGLYNGVLFLADDNFGLRVIDVTTDPLHPQEVELSSPTTTRISGYIQPDINGSIASTGGYINLSLYPYDGKIYVFVLDFYHGVKVFDVSDPHNIDDPVLKDTRTNIWFGSVSLLSDLFITETGGRLTSFVTGGDATGSNYVVARLDVSFEEDLPLTNFGRCVTPGEARSVCISGDYAYVADGVSGLTVVDISDIPAEGSVLSYNKVGSYSTGVDFSYNVFIDGTLLYLATGESGLNRLNITNPIAPLLIDKLQSPISGDDICVAGKYTYMLDRNAGLRIFDSSEPSYPLLRSFISCSGELTDMVVAGDYVYVSDKESERINIINVADPYSPFITSAVISSTMPQKMFIDVNTLYVAGAKGISIFDISDPLHPNELGTAVTSGAAVSIFVDNGLAFVAQGSSGVEIFDIRDLNEPVRINSITMHDARDICTLASGESVYALVADGIYGLKIINVTDAKDSLAEQISITKMDTGTDSPKEFSAVSVAAIGNMVFVGMGDNGILSLNFEDPLNPIEVDHTTTSSFSSDIVPQSLSGTNYVTVAEKSMGFRILYQYSSSETDEPGTFVPSIDAGCFINSVSG